MINRIDLKGKVRGRGSLFLSFLNLCGRVFWSSKTNPFEDHFSLAETRRTSFVTEWTTSPRAPRVTD